MVDASDVNVNVSRRNEREYQVVACGNSAEDLAIITTCLLVLWGLVASYYLLLLHAALETADTGAALWLFFGLFFIGVTFLALILTAGGYEEKLKAKQKANLV